MGEIDKSELDKAQKLINECRKNGILPIDICAEDESRAADNLEDLDETDSNKFAQQLAATLNNWQHYEPISFWDFQSNYVEMLVEKIDLKSLFLPICQEYHVPIMNARGWTDINMRAGMMRRFQEHEEEGRKCVLLYCGDFDPAGLNMPKRLLNRDPENLGHLTELENAVGWNPDNLKVDRFGLNLDFIEEHGLPWIENLKTSGAKDLADPEHKQHNADYVQSYLKEYGARKLEANALVVRPEAGRELCRNAILKYLSTDGIREYQEALAQERQKLRAVLPQAVRIELEKLTGKEQSSR
jgi:hypothetical protein